MDESRSVGRTLLQYAAAVVLSLLAVGWVIDLNHADLRIPFDYEGDGLMHQVWIKTLIETGWYSFNERFGAPGGMDLNEFPSADILHYAVIWLLAKAFPDACVLFNVYYLLGTALAACTMLFVLRQLGVRFIPALAASVLFPCLPFHFLRLSHFFLASYYPIPLGIYLAIRIYRGESISLLGTLFIGIVLGLSGIYFAFFTCFFLLLIGSARALTDRTWKPLLRSLVVIAIVFSALFAALYPAIRYKKENPYNPDASYRLPAESETLGLKMMQLVVPVRGHRIGAFRTFRSDYDKRSPLINENSTASLGLLGSIGFAYLILRFLLLQRNRTREGSPLPLPSLLDALALLTAGGFLLGTVSGFGAFFAYFVSPWIRGYNRISVFIGLFALMGIAVLIDRLLATRKSTLSRIIIALVTLAIIPLALAEQTSPRMEPQHEINAERFRGEKQFVEEIERNCTPGQIVYEIPYRAFPDSEGEPPGILFRWYDLLRPELHSKTLHWTAGSTRGRQGDLWIRRMENKPLEQRCIALADAGCAGIMVFREAFRDQGIEVERTIKNILKTAPIVDPQQRMAFYSLEGLTAKRSMELGDDWEKTHRQERYPVLPVWGRGAGRENESDEGNSRFCESGTELRLVNPTEDTRKIRLRIEVRLSQPHPDSEIILIDGTKTYKFPITDLLMTVEQDFELPPGTKLLKVECRSDHTHHFEVFKSECVDQ